MGVMRFDRFSPPFGLGWTLDDVENIIRFKHKYESDGPRQSEKKIDEMRSLRVAIRDLLNPELNTPGRPAKGSNTTVSGNDRGESYTIRRLKRDNPELARAVISGDMTANAAAIAAGFRKKTVSVKVEPEALRLLREVTVNSHGGDRRSPDAPIKIDNISLDSGGTSKSYTLDRLHREAPELYAEVAVERPGDCEAVRGASRYRRHDSPLTGGNRQ